MGILLEQEVGAIGRLCADVSVHVRGGGGSLFYSAVPLGSEILQFIFTHI